MDRSDQKRTLDDVHNDDMSERQGDVLGLGGAVVPKMPGYPSASDDPASVRRRQERASGAEDEAGIRHEDPDRQRSGATGIDMGSGGQGTHISGK